MCLSIFQTMVGVSQHYEQINLLQLHVGIEHTHTLLIFRRCGNKLATSQLVLTHFYISVTLRDNPLVK